MILPPPILLAGGYMGTFYRSRLVLLGFVPVEYYGLKIRGMTLAASQLVGCSPQNYWLVQLGLTSNGAFLPMYETALTEGLGSGAKQFTFPSGLRVGRGATVALNVTQVGQPSALEDLSISLEYGILGQR